MWTLPIARGADDHGIPRFGTPAEPFLRSRSQTEFVRGPAARHTQIDEGRMKRLLAGAAVLLTLGACSVPFISKGGDKKSECDRMSAEAIQTQNLQKARELSAGASACYAKLSS